MSIAIMTNVWRSSQHKGTHLLAILAFADMANDDGYCWPSIEKIAERCRVEPRSINRIINRLVESGELYIQRSEGGPGRTNSYIVTIGMDAEKLVRSLMHYCGYDRSEANKIAESHLAKNPDTAARIPDAAVTVDDQKTLTARRVTLTLRRANPDRGVRGSIIEPSLEPSEKREAAMPPPAPPSPPIDTTTKSLCEQPPIVAYRDVFLRTPSRAQMVQIMAHGVSDLERWRAALSAWCRRGYSPMNLDGMLDWYDQPERFNGTKHEKVNRNGNGEASYDTTIFSCDPSWLYVEPEPAYYPTPGS